MTEHSECSHVNNSWLRPTFPIGRLFGTVVAWFRQGRLKIPRFHAHSWSPYMLRDVGLSEYADDRGAADRPRSPADWLMR